MRLALISGITSGTFGSMRKADELSTTTAPAYTAMGVNFLEMPPPAENSAISTPSKELSLSSSITPFWPRKSTVLPADRALASALSLPTRKARLSMVAMNSAPTAPVTPAMATTGLLFTGSLHQAIKKAPDLFRRGFGSDDAIVQLRAHASRGPRGLCGFGRAFDGRDHGAGLCGRFRSASTGFGPKIGLNEVERDAVVTQ